MLNFPLVAVAAAHKITSIFRKYVVEVQGSS